MEEMQFGSSLHEIDELAHKVLTGEKVATSSLLDYYLIGKKKQSKIGDIFSILNSAKEEVAKIRIIRIETRKFGEITKEFAEEEGDDSLENWRAIHLLYYSRLLSEIGKELNQDTALVCEWFEIIEENTNLSYRPIENEDFETICNLPQNAEELFFMFPKAQFPFTAEQLETAVRTRFDSTVILLNEEVVAFANFYEINENHHCSIGNVIVNPNFRNQGIGKFLIKTMESIGIEKYNASEMHLSCFNTNTNGILLYSKLGYKPYEVEKWIDNENKPIALIELKQEM